jgi:large subunit ribosomal protein L44e
MEMPRRFNTYCPHCDEHNQHEVEKVRTGQPSGMTQVDGRQAERARSGYGNSGKFSSVPATPFKTTPKTNLKYRCSECGRAHLREGWRAGRLELQD